MTTQTTTILHTTQYSSFHHHITPYHTKKHHQHYTKKRSTLPSHHKPQNPLTITTTLFLFLSKHLEFANFFHNFQKHRKLQNSFTFSKFFNLFPLPGAQPGPNLAQGSILQGSVEPSGPLHRCHRHRWNRLRVGVVEKRVLLLLFCVVFILFFFCICFYIFIIYLLLCFSYSCLIVGTLIFNILSF